MTHGQKKEEVLEDENSSQSSQASYSNDLCKKNRIEEIRANLPKKVSNFYTLKYYKGISVSNSNYNYCVLYFVFGFLWMDK